VRANLKVEADRGRVALMRGPLVYCMEGIDNAEGIRSLVVPAGSQFTAEHRGNLLGGITIVRGTAADLQRTKDGSMKSKLVELLAVPYFANCNREPCEMRVWLTETQ